MTFTFTITIVRVSYFLHNPDVIRIAKPTLIFFSKLFISVKRIIVTYNGYVFSYFLIHEEISPITSYQFRELEAKYNITFQKHEAEQNGVLCKGGQLS